MAEQRQSRPELDWDRAGIAMRARIALDMVRYVGQRFKEHRCMESAAALSYTSLLALVPLCAIGFAIFAAFPAFDNMQELVMRFVFSNFAPHASDTVGQYLETFLANVGKLTGAGTVFLVITAIMLLSVIESTFNQIWRVRRPRPLVIRLMAFWTVLTLGPVLLGLSLSVSSFILAQTLNNGDGSSIGALTRFIPLLLQAIGFSLLYLILPNTHVRWTHALTGGVVAAFLFECLKFGFGIYISNFGAYQTIYGALSTLPVFLIWMYLSWAVVLSGAIISAAIPAWIAEHGNLLKPPAAMQNKNRLPPSDPPTY
ncbi:MAG TPA: virulence factor BrkB family protein [Alphaproteobacteria bacterium]|nr:virulence factor BrkB family protein [Alphaproteobacteria bacterium]